MLVTFICVVVVLTVSAADDGLKLMKTRKTQKIEEGINSKHTEYENIYQSKMFHSTFVHWIFLPKMAKIVVDFIH